MAGLFRQLKRSVGAAPFNASELELLADIADQRIWFNNWHYEHPPELYKRLIAEGYIYFKPLCGPDGKEIGGPTVVFGDLPMGDFCLSPALPHDLREAIERFRSNRGPNHKSVRQIRAEQKTEALRKLRIKPEARLAVHWNLFNDNSLGEDGVSHHLPLPASIDDPPERIQLFRRPGILVTYEEQVAVLDDLMRMVDCERLLAVVSKRYLATPRTHWELFEQNLREKREMLKRLYYPDKLADDPVEAYAEWNARKAERGLAFALMAFADGTRWELAIHKLFNANVKHSDYPYVLVVLDRAGRVRLAKELGVPVPDLLRAWEV